MSIDAGSDVFIQETSRDEDGALTSMSVIALVIKVPDGNIVDANSSDITSPSVGVNRCRFRTTVDGTYYYTWRLEDTSGKRRVKRGKFVIGSED